jgi:hypothetical protein
MTGDAIACGRKLRTSRYQRSVGPNVSMRSLSLQFLLPLFCAQYEGLLFFESLPVVQTIVSGGHASSHLENLAISVCSFLRVANLHMMVVEQISRRMVHLSDGHLEIYL